MNPVPLQVEQPLPAGADDGLAGLARTVVLAADESCHDRNDLNAVAKRYDMINVKLDKTGGLSEAIALVREAMALKLEIMVGCMGNIVADFVETASPLDLDTECMGRSFVTPFFLDFSGPAP